MATTRETEALSQEIAQSKSIGLAIAIQAGIVVFLSAVLMVVWGFHAGLSALTGATIYLLPYGLAYLIFFGRLPGRFSLLGKAHQAKRKRNVAAGFMLAEFSKILLTGLLFFAAFSLYRQANWSILLLAFVVIIVVNWFMMLWAISTTSNK